MVKGTAKEHAKWCPVETVVYKYKKDKKKYEKATKTTNINEQIIEASRYYKKNKDGTPIIQLEIQSNGTMDSSDIFIISINIIIQKLKNLKDNIDNNEKILINDVNMVNNTKRLCDFLMKHIL